MSYQQKYLKYKNKYLGLLYKINQIGGSTSSGSNSTIASENIERIGIGNLINIIMVQEDLRPAILIQPQDYNEVTGKDPVTKSILDAILIEFPELIHSENYQIYQGILISKTNFNYRDDITLDLMGKILGYPCYKDFETSDWIKDIISYTVTIIANLESNSTIEIFSNVCKNISSIEVFKIFAEKANKIFNQEKYKSFLGNIKFQIKIKKNIPNQIIINKLIDGIILDEDEKYKIINELENFGFSDSILSNFQKFIQYENPIHKGIIIDLLVSSLHDSLSPFYPIQYYEGKLEQVNRISEERGNEIINILKRTMI